MDGSHAHCRKALVYLSVSSGCMKALSLSISCAWRRGQNQPGLDLQVIGDLQVIRDGTSASMFAVRLAMSTSGIAMRTRPQVRFVRLLCLRT